MDDLLDLSPEIAAMILEYRSNPPDPYFLSEILVACAESKDKLPPDLLLDAAKLVAPKYQPNQSKRDKLKHKFEICRDIWVLHRYKGFTKEAAIAEVATNRNIEESKVESIWKRAPDHWRKKPEHIEHDRNFEELAKTYHLKS